jgi:acyl-CoA synthetase (AMP-forming)/AMP-acid ligase II
MKSGEISFKRLCVTEIQCPLSQAAELYGDLPALVTDNQVITYGEYHQLTAAVAGKLQKSGVTAGDRITIVSENRIEYPILLMALFRIGTVACPVSPRLPQKTVV